MDEYEDEDDLNRRDRLMDKTEWLQKAAQSIMDLDEDAAKEIASKSIEAGIDPLDMINAGFTEGIRKMGDLFEREEIFLPGLLIASDVMLAAVNILEAALPEDKQQEKLGVVVIGTVEGDIHDIGKNIVALLMKSAGFEVVDIGVGKTEDEIFSAAKENGVSVIGLSALLTTTMPKMQEFIDFIQESGARDQFKVIVGGAPVTQEFADQIGADGYGADATRAVEVTKKLIS